ncbi:MAG: MATE family efflux transporter, partial [Firmicutes bacterium]|nr:MATE family efflux transporter [Bacillota bacterium]
KVFSVSVIFAAVNIVFTTYFLSTKRTGAALMVAAGRSFLLNSVCIFLLPLLFGAGALYTGIIAAELLVSLCCLIYAAARKDWR